MAKKNYFEIAADPDEELAARLIQGLNHPIRRRILEVLVQEPASSTTLADLLNIRLGTVAYHLTRVLDKDCEVVTVVEKHRRRGAWEKVYALKPESYVGVIHWTTIPEPIRSGLRGVSFHSFLKVAIAAMESEAEDPRDYNLYAWQSAAVDEKGHREINEAIERLTKKVKEVEDRCSDMNATEVFPLIVGVAAFESVPIHPPKKLTA